MKTLRPWVSTMVLVTLWIGCDGPSVSLPTKPASADSDDQDDEAEEATYRKACAVSTDCPGDENDVCSPQLGCVECTSNAQCDADEVCIIATGDCENIARSR